MVGSAFAMGGASRARSNQVTSQHYPFSASVLQFIVWWALIAHNSWIPRIPACVAPSTPVFTSFTIFYVVTDQENLIDGLSNLQHVSGEVQGCTAHRSSGGPDYTTYS